MIKEKCKIFNKEKIKTIERLYIWVSWKAYLTSIEASVSSLGYYTMAFAFSSDATWLIINSKNSIFDEQKNNFNNYLKCSVLFIW